MEQWLAERLLFLIPLWFSLSVHEWAHAYSAYRLGDDTARHLGRMTIDPLVHIDPFGTLLLPLLGVPFGWAKPVPVNPARFRRDISMGFGVMVTAIAGPISNLVIAAGSWMLLRVLTTVPLALPPAVMQPLLLLLSQLLFLNVILAAFNMLPIPPLDGSRVVEGLLPYRFRGAWAQFAQFGPILLLAVILLPALLGLGAVVGR